MSSWHFTPKQTVLKSVNSIGFRQTHQFTPKFRHDEIQKNDKHFSKFERNEKEAMMTVRRSCAGDTEIKFPVGNSSQLIRDTQKLLSRYFGNDCSDNVNPSMCEESTSSVAMNDIPVIHHSDPKNNLMKSSHVHLPQQTNFISKSSNKVPHKVLKDEKFSEDLDRKMIHLVGYVEHVIKWNEILKNVNVHVLYNVLGTFINIINGTYPMEKLVFIKGNNGTVLECSFFEVDRPFPKLTRGQLIGCFGNIIDTQKLRLYNVQILDEFELDGTQRVIFLSQRMVQELNNRSV